MRPETQTFVSTTTRRAGPPDLSYRRRYVALNLVKRPATSFRPLACSPKQRRETRLPLVLADDTHTLGLKPRLHRFPNQRGDRLAPLLPQPPEGLELFLTEVDIRSLHRSYTIHHGWAAA